MIIVTGGAGFIGSNIVQRLNSAGISDIMVVDDLVDGHKAINLAGCRIADYLERDDFLRRIVAKKDLAPKIIGVFHQGACTTTTEWNGRMMMQLNFEFSKQLLHYCLDRRIPLVYASSAAVYGTGREFARGGRSASSRSTSMPGRSWCSTSTHAGSSAGRNRR